MIAQKAGTSHREALASLFELAHTQERQEKATHAGLWLDKYITTQLREKTEARPKLVQEVIALSVPELYKNYYKRWETMLRGQGDNTYPACVEGRMVVGLGDESVLETSVALHHTYGVPYIPGSALKGLAAHYAHQRLGNEWHKGGEAHTTVFGDTDHAGFVTFFDALYIPNTAIKKGKEQVLYPDIITVHHPEYYKGGTNPPAPADWDSPTPIPFLSATGHYLLALAAPDLANSSEWLKHTFKILAHALHEYGIGAKTSSGYGRMMVKGIEITGENEKSVQAPSPIPYIRPNQVPKSGTYTGKVVLSTEELRAIAPEATAFLCYEEWPINIVLMIVTAEDAKHWTLHQEKQCAFVREEVRNGCMIITCEPVPEVKKKNKNKNKGNKS